MAKAPKRRNPQDATMRNVRAAATRSGDLKARVTALEDRMAAFNETIKIVLAGVNRLELTLSRFSAVVSERPLAPSPITDD